MNTHEELELKKEFQLERIILFSDAVFAIIITIMVIELRLPENIRDASLEEFKREFSHIFVKLFGYALSFFFVAMFWMRHVKLLGYLKDYNKTFLILNLLFLFAISLFPFAVSTITGFAHPQSIQARLGFTVYIFVVMISMLVFSLLAGYMIRNRETLTYNTANMETDLKWKALRVNYYSVPLIMAIVIVLNLLNVRPDYIGFAMGIYGFITGITVKRMYPKTESGSKPLLSRMFARRSKRVKQVNRLKEEPSENQE